jgi:uncharacterized protein YbjT (DUF2867 family)
MRVLVCGSTGSVGAAVVHALRARGHKVIEASRSAVDGAAALRVDYMTAVAPSAWAERLAPLRLDAIVNCVGILMEGSGQRFERVHAQGPVELFRGAASAGVRRIVQVSALGVDGSAACLAMPYLSSKLQADDTLAGLPVEWAVLRPSLLYGPRSQSAALFATLASLPGIGLPGRGAQRVQPLHVYELAELIARLLERAGPLREVHELGGPAAMSYREMLHAYRNALGLGGAVWLPVPMAMMKLGAWAAEVLPQRAFCRDTLRLLERGSVPAVNASPVLLGRAPTALAHGLAITPPVPLVDLGVRLSPAVALVLRGSLAAMWIVTALVSAALPQQSGVLDLLARCGFEGDAGIAMLVLSCALNLALGTLTLLRPTPWLYAVQAGAVLGYTATAAWFMPELTLDHCGPLLKNLPVLATVLLLWLAAPAGQAADRRTAPRRVPPAALLRCRPDGGPAAATPPR